MRMKLNDAHELMEEIVPAEYPIVSDGTKVCIKPEIMSIGTPYQFVFCGATHTAIKTPNGVQIYKGILE